MKTQAECYIGFFNRTLIAEADQQSVDRRSVSIVILTGRGKKLNRDFGGLNVTTIWRYLQELTRIGYCESAKMTRVLRIRQRSWMLDPVLPHDLAPGDGPHGDHSKDR